MDLYLSIFTFCLVSSITPGPNNIMLMTSGVNHGVKKSLPHLFGIMVGFPLMVTCIGLGLGEIFHKFPTIHQSIKVFGVIYLLYLAWKIVNAGNPKANESIRNPLKFLEAAAFQWLNPKAWVMAVGVIATYTTVGSGGKELIIILAGFLTVGSVSMAIWLILGASLQQHLNSPVKLHTFNILMALLLVFSIFSMVTIEFENHI